MLSIIKDFGVCLPGPDLAGGRPGASWWEASAQLLHN